MLVSAEVIVLKGDFLPEIPAGDLVRDQPQPSVMTGVVHHVGAAVLAGVKPLGLSQPGGGPPCPRYLANDLDRAAQFGPVQFGVRLAGVDEDHTSDSGSQFRLTPSDPATAPLLLGNAASPLTSMPYRAFILSLSSRPTSFRTIQLANRVRVEVTPPITVGATKIVNPRGFVGSTKIRSRRPIVLGLVVIVGPPSVRKVSSSNDLVLS